MRRVIELTICAALMVAFGYFIRFMIYGIDPWFGHGFAAGVGLMTFLMWAVWKLDPEAFNEGMTPEHFERARRRREAANSLLGQTRQTERSPDC